MATSRTVQVVLLKEDAILDGVQSFTKIPFCVSDLKKPLPEKIQALYREFAAGILGCSENQMSQLPPHMLEVMNSQEFFEEATSLLVFSKSLQYVFQLALIDDFSISDIISPKPKRTRYLLSALINFFRSRLSHENDRLLAAEKLETFVKVNETYEEKRDRLTARIKELRQQKIDNEEKIQQMDLNGLRIQTQAKSVKEEKSINHSLKQQQEIEELQNIKIITKATTLVGMAKESIEEKRLHDQNLDTKENAIATVHNFAPTTLDWLEKGDSYSLKTMETREQCEKIQSKSTALMMKVNDCVDEIKNTSQSIEGSLGKKTRRKQKKGEKHSELIKEKQEFANYKSGMSVKMNQVNATLNECAENHTKFTEKKFMDKKQHNQTMAVLREHFQELQSSFSIYNDNLFAQHQHLSDTRKFLINEMSDRSFLKDITNIE